MNGFDFYLPENLEIIIYEILVSKYLQWVAQCLPVTLWKIIAIRTTYSKSLDQSQPAPVEVAGGAWRCHGTLAKSY